MIAAYTFSDAAVVILVAVSGVIGLVVGVLIGRRSS